MISPHLYALIILLNQSFVWADALDVQVVGLFRDVAVVEINRQQYMLSPNQSTPEGVTLLSANSQRALLDINGETRELELGGTIGGTFSPPQQASVSVWPRNGLYSTTGSINGFSVDMLVDTGASAIAMNAATARRLGLDYLNAPRVGVRTASGEELAYEVRLERVELGDIRRYNVRAIVIDGPQPQQTLLGMSFLDTLEIRREGDRLELLQRF
ncbi:retropepsin-like aspartic protease family protein [Methylophaga lonarensis]|uniref:retropepsin-like aspartic protease family protein n=1 Tax=Methylophaga lonarensis TaxID=999151 RepID=UPI003D26E462